jgi:hypothetical protein
VSYQVQVMTASGEWVQAGPTSIATREEAERERARRIEEGADVDGRGVDGRPEHNGSRIVELP